MVEFLNRLPWGLLIFACLTVGLAPFRPPHLWEKMVWLYHGKALRPIDWFDIVLHGTPWVLLTMKAALAVMKGAR